MGFIAARRVAKEVESEFQAFQTVASQVVDVIATAGVVLDQFNNVVRASPGAVQFGLVQNRRLIHAALVKLVDRARISSGAVKEDVVLETGLRRDQVWVDARAARFGENYVMLIVEDRTESKKLEDTRRDFVANVSHELKTPIGAIGLLAEAIVGAADDPQMVQKFAGSMQKESQRLANLVQELIQLSKVQGAKLGENTVSIDLAAAITDAVERNHLLAEQRNIKVVSAAEPGVKIRGDYEMLTTAIRNLIENAIVYSNPGSQVGVGLREVEGIAEIAITDSGIGIPESEQERIFERFYRVDPSRSRETGGTGLGLSIVKHTALNHGGEVRLFSKVGIGSTFTFRVPIENQES
ncbi:two-component sensor histidine kinase [Aquiluna borgnonia]|uniref:Sensor-like histidine kinase SenX3 n=1 Tax=Aquiluna borgnonia TaxID=2499157 RepID=A0A7D4PYD5_9MICO|nr:two-component sensor histidine kinase [Aquiluna borgnonia]